MLMGLIAGFIEASDATKHVFARGGTYSLEGVQVTGYAVYRDGKVDQIYQDLALARAVVWEVAETYAKPLKITQVHIFSTSAEVVEWETNYDH